MKWVRHERKGFIKWDPERAPDLPGKETQGDCSVVALMRLKDVGYHEAFELMKKAGRHSGFEAMPPQKRNRVHRMPPGPNRAKLRSKTYQGIALAMAKQWSEYILNEYGKEVGSKK